MNRVIIRKAKNDDLPSINKLALGLIRALDQRKGTDSRYISQNSRSLLRTAASHFLVAEIDGTVVGYAHFTTRRTVLHHGPSALLDELVIARDCRQAGIGRRLLHVVVQKCRELGCCEVEVSTENANRVARKFYESCGFEERGILLEMDLSQSVERD